MNGRKVADFEIEGPRRCPLVCFYYLHVQLAKKTMQDDSYQSCRIHKGGEVMACVVKPSERKREC